jgi:hypothetical protein
MHLSTNHPTRMSQTWGRLVMATLIGTLGLWQPSLAAEFTCTGGDVACLIRAMNEANANGDENRITLAAGTFTLTTVDNNTQGRNGLPSITGDLTITGAGAATTIIERAAGAPPFRLLHVAATGVLTLEGLTLRGGDLADQPGGGIYIRGTLMLTDSTMSGHTASEGGGIYHREDSAGTLTITRSILSGNVAHGSGGGIFSLRPLTLTHSTVSGNVASQGSGGGICMRDTLMLTDSTLSGNVANGSGAAGGGIFSFAPVTLTNTTLSGNVASQGVGGGISQAIGTLTLTNCTLSGNTASQGGGISIIGGAMVPPGHAILENTILAQNTVPPTGTGPDCVTMSGISPGQATSHGHNLIGDPTGCTISLAASDLTGDPGVGAFVDDGTPGRGHFPLLPASRAIDAIPWGTNGCGTAVFSDQRGQARPQPAGGACDIGAYEVEVAGQPLEGWVTGLTPHTVVCQNVTTAQVVTLSDPVSPWNCEAASLGVSEGDRVTLHVRGPVEQGATDVGGAVAGMAPTSGGCANLTTGQQVPFQHLVGATAGSCVAAGLVVQAGDHVQMSVQGVAE